MPLLVDLFLLEADHVCDMRASYLQDSFRGTIHGTNGPVLISLLYFCRITGS